MARRPDASLDWRYDSLTGLAVGTWVDVKLTKFRGRWDVRLVGYTAVLDGRWGIVTERHGFVPITCNGFINYRLAPGPYPPGTPVVRALDDRWRGLVEWVEGGAVGCRRPDDSIEVVEWVELQEADFTRSPYRGQVSTPVRRVGGL